MQWSTYGYLSYVTPDRIVCDTVGMGVGDWYSVRMYRMFANVRAKYSVRVIRLIECPFGLLPASFDWWRENVSYSSGSQLAKRYGLGSLIWSCSLVPGSCCVCSPFKTILSRGQAESMWEVFANHEGLSLTIHDTELCIYSSWVVIHECMIVNCNTWMVIHEIILVKVHSYESMYI